MISFLIWNIVFIPHKTIKSLDNCDHSDTIEIFITLVFIFVHNPTRIKSRRNVVFVLTLIAVVAVNTVTANAALSNDIIKYYFAV